MGKNRIIALSGEPVSGKGTAVKNLVKKLEETGYKQENIHIISTGTEFRKYFNSITDLIENINGDKKRLKEICDRDELKKFFNNEQYRKILIKTISNIIKQRLNLSHFSIQEANNLNEFKEIRNIVDTLIDNEIKEMGNQINKEEHHNEIWIIDSRLAFHNIPESFSVRLTTNKDVAAKRLFNDKTRGKEDNKYINIKDAEKEREARRKGEQRRYLETYNVDLEDESNYDLIIDTSYSSSSEIADVILKCEECYQKNEYFGKKWASPEVFLPLQTERITLGNGSSGDNFETILESIKENGYLPYSNIEVVNVDGLNYIIEGHHRNFAAAYAGKTLVPYTILAKDDEIIKGFKNKARERANSLCLNYLYGHEWMIQEKNKEFSYKKRFPQLVEKLEKELDR